ncbi:MAG: O-antigen ligase family protein [Solirubrobacterales bacterium]|nr:O-antigen ligase family protein [Solirubrobacterales bacterium]
MESIAVRSAARGARTLPRVDAGALSVWALVLALVTYLAVDGGGYDLIVRNQVGIVIWWIVLIGAVCGLIPVAALGGRAWAALGLFGAFAIWTGVASTWSQSSQLSLDELSRVACYLGVLLLGLALHRDRERALRHTTNALATAIVAVAVLAVFSRLRTDAIPAAHQTGSYLPGAQGRLGWPLNYWNGLAAFVVMGLPLLLAIATSARTLRVQAVAAAGIPVLTLCAYLTFSRGGAIAAAVIVVAFIALAPNRLPKLLTLLVAAAGGAALIVAAVHRPAIERGLVGSVADHQGSSLLVAVLLACAGVGILQAGIGLGVRHATPPRLLTLSARRARALLAAALVALVVVGLAAGAPTHFDHAVRDFERPNGAGLAQDTIARFGATSGNGRYDYWKVAVNATAHRHLLDGFGPGTFQLVWLPRAPYASYVENAHSLYVETFSDVGLVGLALLVAFLVTVLSAALTLVVRSRHEARTCAAGAAAALLGFCVSAAFDWIWQIPVLPAAFLLLAGAVLAPARRGRPMRGAPLRALALGALACVALLAIAIPLATTGAVASSEAASGAGRQAIALADARSAAAVEPDAASPQVQEALVLELERRDTSALAAIRRAARDAPGDWSTWLIMSRLEVETGHPGAALAAYRRARSLNPTSGLFAR